MILNELQNQDVYKRLLSQLPPWFGLRVYGDSSNLSMVLMAYITTSLYNYNQYYYMLPNMRLLTMNDDSLVTLFSHDFLGNTLPQLAGEPDGTYQLRVEANVMRLRGTRNGMANRLFELTGYYPKIFEPWRPLDTGVYGGASSTVYNMYYQNSASVDTTIPGLYGSMAYPYQCFITVYVDAPHSLGDYPAYSGSSVTYPQALVGEYGGAGSTLYSMGYGDDSLINFSVGAQQVYNLINITKVFGTICWVNINNLNINTSSSDVYWVDNSGDQMITSSQGNFIGNTFTPFT